MERMISLKYLKIYIISYRFKNIVWGIKIILYDAD